MNVPEIQPASEQATQRPPRSEGCYDFAMVVGVLAVALGIAVFTGAVPEAVAFHFFLPAVAPLAALAVVALEVFAPILTCRIATGRCRFGRTAGVLMAVVMTVLVAPWVWPF